MRTLGSIVLITRCLYLLLHVNSEYYRVNYKMSILITKCIYEL